MLLQFVNFGILLGAIVYFVRKPVMGYLATRHRTVKERLEEADRLLKEAEGTKRSYEERLSGLAAEIEAYRASVKAQAEKEKKKVLDDARTLAPRISEQAQFAYEQEMKEDNGQGSGRR